jgi:radical SAM superfamily enzyme YgiQ (UPF0313 family)
VIEKYLYNPVQKNTNPIYAWNVFPYTYMYGMSTLAYLTLFKELDTNPDVLAERIFLDSKTTEFLPQNVELMSFSYLFENDFQQIFKILDKYNIPLKASQRKNHPLVFAGGPVLTGNPEPFADFFDFIIIGDGENSFNEVIKEYKKYRHLSREKILEKLSAIKGIYVPSLYEVSYNEDLSIKDFRPISTKVPDKVQKRTADVSKCLASTIISSKAFYSDTMFIELGRGCPQGCKFCTASYLNNPVRYPSFESVKSAIDESLHFVKKIIFIGAMIADNPDFERICDYLVHLRSTNVFEVEFSSLKADKYLQCAVDVLLACNKHEISIAIEAGSQKTRDFIQKQLTEEQLKNTLDLYNKSGIKTVSVYSMIGLPQESQGDILEFVRLAKELKTQNSNLEISYIISSFIPKPGTPFEHLARETYDVLEQKVVLIKSEFEKEQINAKFSNLHQDIVNTIISKANRLLAPFIEYVYKHSIKHKDWIEAYNDFKIKNNIALPDLQRYFDTETPQDELAAWDFIDFKSSNQESYSNIL